MWVMPSVKAMRRDTGVCTDWKQLTRDECAACVRLPLQKKGAGQNDAHAADTRQLTSLRGRRRFTRVGDAFCESHEA